MKLLKYTVYFLIVNFGALYLGILLMDNGPQTEWYNALNKAPWSPPGWLFGVAWTTIMICFSVYMAKLCLLHKKILPLFIIQWLLNVSWNYIFFNQHLLIIGAINLILLTILISIFLIKFRQELKGYSLLVIPYFLWLLVANSLNLFIVFNN